MLRAASLRIFAPVAAATLTTVAVAAAVALVFVTTYMRRRASEMETAADAALAAESMRAELLAFGRAGDQFALTGEARYADAQSRHEADVRRTLDQLEREVASEQERASFDGTRRHVLDYLEARRNAEQRVGSLPEILVASTQLLDRAEQALDRQVDLNSARLRASHRAARQWDRIANIVGLCAAGLLLLGAASTLLLFGVLVTRPLLALGRTITRFARGAREVRAPVRGAPELRTIGATFNEMADHLANQERARLVLLAGVAHDLRNPLAAMKLGVDNITRRPLSDEQRQRALQAMGRQIVRLERLLGDFLDASQIEAGHFRLRVEPMDVRALVEETVQLFRSMSASHEVIARTPTEPVMARCDPARLAQVLTNLVSNAIKYSPAGGRVIVTVAAAEHEVLLAVTDHGVGIAAEDTARIFVPFHRAGPLTETVAGVGVGLSVTKRIVAAHGGTIEVESRVGEGSTFRVHLPREPMIQAANREPSAPTLH